MGSTFTAITKKAGDWWIGWIEEVPGVNAQEATKEELISSLREILFEALEYNRSEQFFGFIQIEWFPPSRLRKQPAMRRRRSRSLLFIRQESFPVSHPPEGHA